MNKAELMCKIHELDFALHELELFLDSHPTNQKAMELLSKYRKRHHELVSLYEENFGSYIVTKKDVPTAGCWKWLQGPWPWENNFMEE